MLNTSTIQDDGTDAALAKWPGKFGTTAGNVGGKIQLTASTATLVSAIDTDFAANPLVLDYLEGELYVQGTGTNPKASFGVETATSGTRCAWTWTAGAWRFVDQTGFADNHAQGSSVSATAGTTLVLAMAYGAAASRYGVSSPVATNVYAFHSLDSGVTWVQDYTQPAPAYATSGCRIAAKSQEDTGSGANNIVTVDRVNLITSGSVATVPSIPTAVTVARSSTDTTVATLTWAAPASNGGSAITGYIVSRDGVDTKGTGAWTSAVLSAATLSYSFGYLTNSSYNLTVTAVNAVGNSPAATAALPAYSPAVLPKIGSLYDDFNDNSFDPNLWVVISPGISDQGGTTYIDSITSTAKYLLCHGDLTDSAAYMKFPDLSTEGLVTGDAVMLLVRSTLDATQVIRIYYRDGVLYSAFDAGSPDTLQAGRPYDAAAMAWWRIRHDATANLIYLEYSADALTWSSLARSGFAAPSWINDVQAGECAQNLTVAPPVTSVPTVPTALALTTSGTSITVSFGAPTSTGGSPVTSYKVTRDGLDASGAGPYTTTIGVPGSITLTNLQPSTTYTVTVAAANANGSGPAASASITTAAAGGGGAPFTPIAGADWSADVSSKTQFQKDFYNGYPYGQEATGHQDNGGGDLWYAGSNQSFYPFTFFSDATAPDGKYVRVFAERVSTNDTADAGTVGGKTWIGGIAISKRGWTGGYVEFAARFPAAGSGKGMFPAMWMFGQTQNGSITDNTGTWTQVKSSVNGSGLSEIDILETFGVPGHWYSTMHAVQPSGAVDNARFVTSTVDNNWHSWGLDWNPSTNKVDIYFDRVKVGSSSAADAATYLNQEMCARFNYSMGPIGTWLPGPDGTTPNVLYFDVSYVKHYAAKPF